MSELILDVPGVGPVQVIRKKGLKSIRLRVDLKGRPRVTMPWLASKQQAIAFIQSKQDWIASQQKDSHFQPYNGMLLGKTLQLLIKQNAQTTRTVQKGKVLIVPFIGEFEQNNPVHTLKIEKAIIKALRSEAEKILLPRLREFADMYGFDFKSSGIKQVIGRWGSCDSKKHITLSLYLVQLPLEMIDYVLIHELSHTIHMNHSAEFWGSVQRYCPDYKIVRKRMKQMQPRIYDAKAFMA